MVKELFEDPDAFFEAKIRKGSIRKPALVVALAGVGFMTQMIVVYLLLGPSMISEIQTAWSASLLGEFVLVFGFWLLLLFGSFLVAVVLGGRPSIGLFFRLTGWGFVPIILTGPMWALGLYIGLRDRTVPAELQQMKKVPMTASTPDQFSGLNTFLEQAHRDPVFLLAFVLGVVCIVYGAHIISYAVKHASELNQRQSQIAVAIPLLVFLVWRTMRIL